MRSFQPNLRAGPALLLTGLGLSLAMPPFSLYPVAWIALVPLFARWTDQSSPRDAWLEASTAFLILYAVSGFWVLRHPIWESAVASFGAGLLLPLIQGLPFAAALPFRRQYGSFVGFTALIAFSITVEYLLLYGPMALPWFLLGHTHSEALLFNQFVDITGVLGLSAWIWLLNVSVWAVITLRGFTTLVPLVVITALLAGPYKYAHDKRAERNPYVPASIAVVQPALPVTTWADGLPHQRLSRLSHLSDSLLDARGSSKPQLVVWPETALPAFRPKAYEQEVYEYLEDWTARRGVGLLTGAIRHPTGLQTSSETTVSVSPYNSALLFNGQNAREFYDKRQLVPFAEAVPGSPYISVLSKLAINAGGVSSYRRGRHTGLLELDSLQFATQICFESLFGRLHREEVQQGASFLVVLAQNGWWGQSAGPVQHTAFTRLRAIESRRAVIMASASGASGLIYPDGTIGSQLSWMQPSAAVLQVPVNRDTTTYVTYGDWPGLLALAAAFILSSIYLNRRFSNSPEKTRRSRTRSMSQSHSLGRFLS